MHKGQKPARSMIKGLCGSGEWASTAGSYKIHITVC